MRRNIPLAVRVAPVMNRNKVVEEGPPGGGGPKAQSLEGLLDFEAEEEKLWWQGADVEAQAVEAVELTWLQKAKKWMDDKLYQLWQAIEDYFDYKEE